MILEIKRTTPWRIVSIYKPYQIQRVVQPNASFSATRSTVVPDTLDNFAFGAPMLAYTSHHAYIRGFVCFCANATQGNKVITGWDGFPSIKGIRTGGYTPYQTETHWARKVTIKNKRKPTAACNPASCCICNL